MRIFLRIFLQIIFCQDQSQSPPTLNATASTLAVFGFGPLALNLPHECV